jgi:hypothetical protein
MLMTSTGLINCCGRWLMSATMSERQQQGAAGKQVGVGKQEGEQRKQCK